MNENKKNFIIILSFVAFFFGIFILGMKLDPNYQEPLLLEIKQLDKKLSLSYNGYENASFYQIIVRNQEKEIYNGNTKEHQIDLDLDINYGESYQVWVVAYDKNNKEMNTSLPMKIALDKIYFDKTIDRHNPAHKDYTLKLIGNIPPNCVLAFYLPTGVIYEMIVTKNEIKYPREIFSYLNTPIKAVLKNEGQIFDEIMITIDDNPIGQLQIISPEDAKEYSSGDVLVKVSGGSGSELYNLYVYEQEELIYQKSFKTNETNIPKNFLYENVLYKLIVTASFSDVKTITVKDDVSFRIISLNKVKPVYASRYKYVSYKEKITLNTLTSNTTIMYTLDGSTPSESNGLIYNDAIEITGPTVIKALAINNEGYKSIVSTFEYYIGKKDIAIYVSPSRQEYNKGVSAAGYTTEAQIMNRFADVLIPKLKNAGYIIYRNNPKTDIMAWASESKKNKVDLHLALHSNGSVMHDESGVKTYINEEYDLTYSLANIIQQQLVSVYHNKSHKNNSVSFAHDRLGEVRPNLIPFGILLEIGYHDNYDDAFWLVNNMDSISDAILRALNIYFGY